MDHPALPNDVVVMPATDVDGEWERFRIFEALHHRMRICNPMTATDLEAVADVLNPLPGQRVLDIACGHGELLIRLAERAAIAGVGVDLSPWVIVRAHREAAQRPLQGTVKWWLGNAHELPVSPRRDIVTCLGASWIWHGFAGTVRALATRTRPGGRIAIGDLRLRDGADADVVFAEHGRVSTKAEQAAVLAAAGVTPLLAFDAAPSSWLAYQDRILESVESYAEANPGPEATAFLREEAQWRLDHERDQRFMTWTVWVGETQP
jgi:SAM-dependent methyltransferase